MNKQKAAQMFRDAEDAEIEERDPLYRRSPPGPHEKPPEGTWWWRDEHRTRRSYVCSYYRGKPFVMSED